MLQKPMSVPLEVATYPTSIKQCKGRFPMTALNLPSTTIQLPLIDMTGGVSVSKAGNKQAKKEKIKVNDMFAQVRQLHEQINTYLHKCPATERPSIGSPADAAELLKPFIANLDHEELWVLVLDRRNRVIQLVRLYQGSVNASQVRVGEVFRQAIIEQASAIVIAHNHPSGDPTPSPDDVAVTRAIVQAGKLVDIEVLDRAPWKGAVVVL
jgi:DNA repair protein RadC